MTRGTRTSYSFNLHTDLTRNPTEYMTIEESFAPYLHRLNQAIRRRAVEPSEPVGPPADVLIKWSHPPQDLVKQSAKSLAKLVEAASVKKGQSSGSLIRINILLLTIGSSSTKSQGKARSS